MKMKIKKHGKVFYCSIKLINNFTLNGCNLYTQYQTFGKKEMVRDNGNCKNLLLPNHHLIKIIRYMMLKNLMLKNFVPFQFSLKILNPPHKNTFKITSVVCSQCGAIFTVFPELL